MYGLVVGLPAGIGLPLGVYLTDVVGFDGLVRSRRGRLTRGTRCAPGDASAQYRCGEEQHVKVLGGLRGSGLLMPTFVFAAVTVAAGISVTFVPLAVAGDNHSLVAAALLMQAITAPAARWLAGRLRRPDRSGEAAVRRLSCSPLSAQAR